jgi:hypothetical protein
MKRMIIGGLAAGAVALGIAAAAPPNRSDHHADRRAQHGPRRAPRNA